MKFTLSILSLLLFCNICLAQMPPLPPSPRQLPKKFQKAVITKGGATQLKSFAVVAPPPKIITLSWTGTKPVIFSMATVTAPKSQWKLLTLGATNYIVPATNSATFFIETNSTGICKLIWNPVTNTPSVTNYTLYCGLAARNYVKVFSTGTATNATLELPSKRTWFITVTATANGQESLFSNEVLAFIPPRLKIAVK